MSLTKPTRILITGASGLLGLNLALTAARSTTTETAKPGENHRYEVYGVTHHHPLQHAPFHVVQADLLERGALEWLLDTLQPDWVIHCAALANLDDCEADPDLAHRLNAEIPGLLAALVAKGGARRQEWRRLTSEQTKPIRLVHISTDAVFDGVRGDYGEEDQPSPLGVYARTKLAGERAVLAANPQAIVARVNLFGWSLMGRRSLAEFFFNNLSAGKRVQGFTDVYFCPLLVNDLAGVLVRMLEGGLSGLYHVVSRDATSKYDFGVAVARRFGLDQALITPTLVADSGLQARRSPNLTLRTDKLSAALNNPTPSPSPVEDHRRRGGTGSPSRLGDADTVHPFEIPSWQEGMERFFDLYQSGYPQMLQQLAAKE
jgi:dTDP-4-dehydrorhamnose reductase